MDISNQFLRSVNIHKITDGEYIDMYVEMFLWLDELFKDLKISKNDKYPLNTYYKDNNNNVLIEDDKDLGCIWIDDKYLLKIFNNKFKLGIYNYNREYLKVFHIYFTNFQNLVGTDIDNINLNLN